MTRVCRHADGPARVKLEWVAYMATTKAPLIVGTAGSDILSGSSTLANAIYAGAGNDLVSGGERGDILVGEAGQDTIYGNGGNDGIWGGVVLSADVGGGHFVDIVQLDGVHGLDIDHLVSSGSLIV